MYYQTAVYMHANSNCFGPARKLERKTTTPPREPILFPPAYALLCLHPCFRIKDLIGSFTQKKPPLSVFCYSSARLAFSYSKPCILYQGSPLWEPSIVQYTFQPPALLRHNPHNKTMTEVSCTFSLTMWDLLSYVR